MIIEIQLLIIGIVIAIAFSLAFGILTFWIYKLLNDKK